MNGTPNSQAPNAQTPPLISVSVSISPRLKRRLVNILLLLLFAVVVIYTLYRDEVWNAAQQGVTPSSPARVEQSPPVRGTKFIRKGLVGESFTINEGRTYHLTVRGLTGSHIVINKWKVDPPLYSSYRNNKKGPDFDDEVYLEPGEYVLTFVAKVDRPAKADASIELR